MQFNASETLLERALKTIPLGSQTFSKSFKHYPVGVSPLFAEKGQGAYLYDADGNQFIDMVNALAAVTLGYCDHDVNEAIKKQLDKGVIFSLSNELELRLSEKIVELIPCAEMVRYGKNGSDATTAAIRLARAYTNKEEVAVCGYHGWHDWYIGSTDKKLGVPKCVQELTHSFQYNNIDSLKKIIEDPDIQLAAVIMEPMNVYFPEAGFLQGVRELCTKNDIVLIFDETVTGFRLSMNGAQGLFGVTPDLATFGKGIANGMPLSVLCGRKDIMSMLDEVFFSFTYGGELLSIAAALEVIDKLEREGGLSLIEQRGERLKAGLTELLDEYQLNDVLQVTGHGSWSFLLFKILDETELYLWKTLFMQETLAQGLITLGSHNLTLSHDDDIIDQVLECYGRVFQVLLQAKQTSDIRSRLQTEPLTPLFSVRKK